MNKRRVVGWRKVLRIAWPLIIANGFWNLQVTVDRIFLGNFSVDALGAAMAAVGLFWAPMALVQQTAAYVTTFVAQYFGAKETHMVGPSVWHSIFISVAGGFLFLLFIPITDTLFEWVGHSERLQSLEADYFKALCYSALPTALVAAASGFFTGIGRSSIIMWINGVGLVVNVILDYLFIFGNFGFPEWGIAGAGYATTLANWAAAIFGFYLVFTKSNAATYSLLSGWRFNLDLFKRFVRFGIPSGMQWALEGLAFTAFLVYVGRMPNGEAALSASSITVTIMMLAILPTLGIAQAVSVLVGQHLGGNRPGLAEKASWHGLQLALIYIFVTGSSFVLFPEFYMNWFHNSQSPQLWAEVSEIVPFLLVYVAFFILFDSSNLVFSFALKGAGDTRFVSLVALTLPWPLMVIPTALVSTWDNGVYWAWGAASIFIVVQALVFWRRFVGGKWKGMRVIH